MIQRLYMLDAITRLRLHLQREGGFLTPAEALEARLRLMEITALVNRAPVLALPAPKKKEGPDRKCLAAHDDTFLTHE